MHSDKYGYTLVEILVVVAIVFILMAVIIPTVNSVQKKGLQATCMSNLKQIGSALELYVMDNDYYYPQTLTHPSGGTDYRWDVFLARSGYVTGVSENISAGAAPGDLFICPMHLKMAKRANVTVIRSYAMNAMIRKLDSPTADEWTDLHVKKIWSEFPYSEVILVCEANEGTEIGDNWETVYYNQGWGRVAWTRHGERSNYLFADGHVEALTQTEAQGTATSPFEWE